MQRTHSRIKLLPFLATLIMLLVGHSAASATDYYVDVNGDDSNDGLSAATPWQTIQFVRSRTFVAGDTIKFRGGQTFSSSIGLDFGSSTKGTAGNPITVTSYGGGQATIAIFGASADSFGFRSDMGSYITLENLKFQGVSQSSFGSSGIIFNSSTAYAGDSRGITIKDCTVTGFYEAGIRFVSKPGSPNGYPTVYDVSIENCNVSSNGEEGIQLLGDYRYYFLGYPFNNVTLKDNFVGSNGFDGVHARGISGSLFEHNVFANNGALRSGPSGLIVEDTYNVAIRFNEARGNTGLGGGYSSGIKLARAATYSTVEYNYCHDNGAAEFAIDSTYASTFNSTERYSTHDNTVRYNVSQNTGSSSIYPEQAGIYLNARSYDNRIYNNTVYSTSRPCFLADTFSEFSDGNIVANNIFYSNGATNDIVSLRTTDPAVCFLINNCYYAGLYSFRMWLGFSATSISQLRSLGHETYSGTDYGLVADPLLLNPGNGGDQDFYTTLLTNYVPLPGSPVVRAGRDLTGAPTNWDIGTVDFNNNALSAPRNIGASDYKGAVAEVESLSLSASATTAGLSVTGTLTLNAPATIGGQTFTLASPDSFISFPASVTIPAGGLTATFTVNSTAVKPAATATITATGPASSASATLLVGSLHLSLSTATATGTVTLDVPAPTGGAIVSLSSSNPGLTVPATITIPQGETTGTFPLGGSSGAFDVTITATYALAEDEVTLHMAGLDLSVDPTSVVSGAPSTGTVTLGAPAPGGGAVISLSHSGDVSMPTSINIAAGETTGTFTIDTSAAGPSDVTITATYGVAIDQATLSIKGLSVSLQDPDLLSGWTTVGTVQLGAPAPAGGTVVTLTSDEPNLTLPATVTVASGDTSATFTVGTANVDPSGSSKTITATRGLATGTVQLKVWGLQLNVNPSTDILSGGTATGTVYSFVAARAGGAVINLTSSDARVVVPATVTILEGEHEATFTIDASSCPPDVDSTIKASSGKAADQSTVSVEGFHLSVIPNLVFVGNSSLGYISLHANAPAGGATFTLSTSDPSAGVPSTVTVPEGQLSATFPITTSAMGTFTITATSGLMTDSQLLYVGGLSLSVSPAPVSKGTPSTGTVTLYGPAGPGGHVVNLSSDKAGVIVPSSITIAAGQATGTFQIDTTSATPGETATITASIGSVSAQASLSIFSAMEVTLDQDKTLAGISVTGKVRLGSPAPAGGLVVDMSASDPCAQVDDITIAAGEYEKAFTVMTTAPAAITDVTITGTVGPESGSALLKVGLMHVNLSRDQTTAGVAVSGQVTLDFPAPTGINVPITSSESAATIPGGSVFFGTGDTVKGFTVNSTYVASAVDTTITAAAGAVSVSAPLKLGAIHVTLDTPTAPASQYPITGTVTLDVPMLSNSNITMTSSDASVVSTLGPQFGGQLTITAGNTSVQFYITPASISASGTSDIKAAFAAAHDTKTQTITADTAKPVFFFAIPGSAVGGSTDFAQVIVYMSGGAPAGGLNLSITSSDPCIRAVGGPNFLLPEGEGAAFPSLETDLVSSDRTVTLTATASGVSLTTTFEVKAMKPTLTLNRTSILGGGQLRGTVTLSGAPRVDTTVNLQSSDASATVPPSVVVKAGATAAVFPIATASGTTDKHVTFTASFNGFNSQASLDIVSNHLRKLEVTPTTVFGGAQYSGRVTVTGTVVGSPLVVDLTGTNVSLGSNTVTIPVGQNSATFTYVADDVDASTAGKIRAALASGEFLEQAITIKPNVLVSLTLNPDTVRGGSGTVVTGTVTLSAPLANGGSVALSCPSPRASVPATVTIAPGSKVGTFTVGHSATSITKVTTVKASRKGQAKTAKFTINP